MRRSWLFPAAKAAVTLFLVGLLAYRVDLEPVAERLGRIDVVLITAATAAMLSQLLLAGWRWSLVIRTLDAELRCRAIVRLTLIGQFFNQTLPSAIGGDAVRAWLATHEGLPLGKAVNGVLIDRVIALLVLITIIGATLPLLADRVPDPAFYGAAAGIVVATAAGLLVFFAVSDRATAVLARWRATAPLARLAADLRRSLSDPVRTVPIVMLSVAVHLGVITVGWLIARALSIDVTLIDCIVLIPPVVLLTTLPISIAGWGVREGAMVVGFGFLGVAAPEALAMSVVFGLVQIAAGLPGGAIWLFQGRPVVAPGGGDAR
ncbi:MAG TPA: lysylphosphatidylglycerol synthase transmembrane domain-containing protein [Alphaproteobacteria bacterium]